MPVRTFQTPPDLQKAMRQAGIYETDLEEKFIRSSGPGGQHVNKTATCVILRHRPSGELVRCQAQRSQLLNRIEARRMLVYRLEEKERASQLAKQAQSARLRQQKRRRSKAAREVLLQQKRLQSEKKKRRRRVDPAE